MNELESTISQIIEENFIPNQDDIVFKLSMKDVDKQNDIGEGETATEAYQMLDTRLTKTFDLSGKSKLKVSLFGRNLLEVLKPSSAIPGISDAEREDLSSKLIPKI